MYMPGIKKKKKNQFQFPKNTVLVQVSEHTTVLHQDNQGSEKILRSKNLISYPVKPIK